MPDQITRTDSILWMFESCINKSDSCTIYTRILNMLEMTKYLVVVSLTITIVCFGVLWAEDAWADFYHWGPPFTVGSIVIKNWGAWGVFVGLLVLFQASQVYLEETLGRDIERKHIHKQPLSSEDIFVMACYNFYKAAGTILHILIAVTRVDVWLLIAFVDTIARVLMWNSCYDKGRKPRIFYKLI